MRFVIFLNNKLGSCDTVTPFVVDLKANNKDVSAEFITFDWNTYKNIQRNTVLADAIKTVGRLRYLGSSQKGSSLWRSIRRLKSAVEILRYIFLAIRNDVTVLHFKELNEWPLRIFDSVAHRRVFLIQGAAFGYGGLEKEASDMMKQRRYSKSKPVGAGFVFFHSDWAPITDPRTVDIPRLCVPPPFIVSTWRKYIDSVAPGYLRETFQNARIENHSSSQPEYVVFILTWLGPSGILREEHLFPRLFEQTLASLARAECSLPILVKPHPASRPQELKDIERKLSDARQLHGLRIASCHLHPSVLASNAKFAIGNCYSTTFSIFRHYGVPTIEFTDYRPDILLKTLSGSIRPEFVSEFINSDAEILVHALRRNLMASVRSEYCSPVESQGKQLLEFFSSPEPRFEHQYQRS
jgi:hypothetical protein